MDISMDIFNPIDCSQQSEETPSKKCALDNAIRCKAQRHSVASDNVSEESGGSLEIQRKTINMVHFFWCTYMYIHNIYMYIPVYLLYVVYVTYTWGNLWCV